MKVIHRLALLLVGLSLSGCTGSTARVTGNLTLGGEPLADAELTFALAGTTQTVHGKSGPDGRYWLNYPQGNGMPSGKYRVVVTRYTLPDGKPVPSGEEGVALRGDEERVRKWSVQFEHEIKAGENQLDLEWTLGQPHQEP
jgi:hypothetical protein